MSDSLLIYFSMINKNVSSSIKGEMKCIKTKKICAIIVCICATNFFCKFSCNLDLSTNRQFKSMPFISIENVRVMLNKGNTYEIN